MPEKKALYAIGIDRGATNIRAGLVRSDGVILNLIREKAHANFFDTEENIRQFADLIHQVLSFPAANNLPIEGVGIGTAGQVNKRGEVVGHNGPADLEFTPIPLRMLLAAALKRDLPIWVDNDSKTAAWGEYLYGAGRGYRNMICLTVGTGIGGGIVVDGKLLQGASGLAGHMGLMSVNMRGPRCPCGIPGCLEYYASGTGIAVAAREALKDRPDSKMMELSNGNAKRVTSELVFNAAQKGDPLAVEIIQQAGYTLGIAISSLLHILEPEAVVIGGGVADQGEVFMRPVQEAVAEYSMVRFSGTPIIAAELGNLAGVVGASALCF